MDAEFQGSPPAEAQYRAGAATPGGIEGPGRQKSHYLNPVPIRRIYDRWIDSTPSVGPRH
jgi:hypothetical protein